MVDWNQWATCVHREVRSGFMGLNERIINLSQSETPVSQQRHWSRNIGLHPLATTLSCLAHTFPSCKLRHQNRVEEAHFLIYIASRSPISLPLTKLIQIYGRERERKGSCWGGKSKAALIQISWRDTEVLRGFKVSVYTRLVSVRCSSIDCLREDWKIPYSWLSFLY